MRLLLAVAAFLTIAGIAAARVPDPAIGSAGATVAGQAAGLSPRDGIALGAAEIEPEADAADAELGPGRVAGQAVAFGRRDRVSYRPARTQAATPLAAGSPRRPPRDSD